MHVYLIRHGQTIDNAHKVVSGDRETALSELGKHQAKAAAGRIKKLHIDLILCSPLKRAQTTAHIIAEEIGYPKSRIVTIQELKERSLGQLEGTSYKGNERLNGNFPAVDHIHGVEPLPRFYSRVQHALRQIMQHKDKTILVICHIGVGRMLRAITQGKPAHAMYDQPRLENATIYQLL